jgi:hypothetical protein
MEAQVHPLVVVIPRFIQLILLLLSLKPMDARLGGIVLPSDEEPHAAIEPSALTATKALKFE